MERQDVLLNDVVIKFAGDSGDGMQLTGTQFTNNTALAWYRPRHISGFSGRNSGAPGHIAWRERVSVKVFF
jgi:hypothetical protein